ncbi:MAG TPA: cupin domain-containing protein, partial [Candidatus Marinimicrobia bacterium]|nr:cupin domain-containing protein [Candidatus Neomarinimicrobiota bacterium]
NKLWLIAITLILFVVTAFAENEKEIPLDKVQTAVLEAAQKAVPGIELTEAEVERTIKGLVCEIEGTLDGKEYEIEVSSDGKVLEIEEEDEDGNIDNAELKTKLLLSSQRFNILERPIVYPTQQPAEVSSVIRVLQPAEETGWHKHMVPLHAYILQGEINVEYDTSVIHTVSKGDAFVGVTDVWHNTTNTSNKPAVVLVVFMGAEGLENTINRE